MKSRKESQFGPIRDERDSIPPVLSTTLADHCWWCLKETVSFCGHLGKMKNGTVSIIVRLHKMLSMLTAMGSIEGLKAIRLHVTTGITARWTGYSALAHRSKELRGIWMELTPVHLEERHFW